MKIYTTSSKDKHLATIGLLLALASITMLFGTFISSFFVLKIRLVNSPNIPPKIVFIGAVNTIVILLSSVCFIFTGKKYEKKNFEKYDLWLICTILLGILFISGQLFLWSELETLGIPITFGQLSDMFYLLSGVHVIHLIAGMILLFWIQSYKLQLKSNYSIYRIQNIGLFWHFLTFIWIIIFFITLI